MHSQSLSPLESSSVAKTRADGQPMKKRGPKPRNQPALTRKQELARKAQRNHCERKEFYVKALEQEVIQLKHDGAACNLLNRNASLEEENQRLRQVLERHEIIFPAASEESIGASVGPISLDPSRSILDPLVAETSISSVTATPSSPQRNSQEQLLEGTQNELDYEQIGIDFVLAIERPCLCHMRVNPEDQLYGHALMASCVPGVYPEMNSNTPSDASFDTPSPSLESYTLSKSCLAGLLEHSKRLSLNGEVTPVMVWDMILNSPRLPEFTVTDFNNIIEQLSKKVKCYGFGAVFEEFEVREVIENILLSKPGLVS
ncbi:BZIP-type transcription factor [Xylogone sp. PMI_703]|nr:BZIP-type transcription factor [Xylogone sp. PMI_703]